MHADDSSWLTACDAKACMNACRRLNTCLGRLQEAVNAMRGPRRPFRRAFTTALRGVVQRPLTTAPRGVARIPLRPSGLSSSRLRGVCDPEVLPR